MSAGVVADGGAVALWQLSRHVALCVLKALAALRQESIEQSQVHISLQ